MKELILKNKKLSLIFIIGGVLFISLFFLLKIISKDYGFGYTISKSINEDFIIYKKKYEDLLENGNIVYFKFPKDTLYYKKDMNFAKYLGCKEGDTLKVEGLKYYCNEKFIGEAVTRDYKGREAKRFIYNGVIPNNKFFMIGSHLRSYDSKYWGFIDKSKIKGVAVWKW